MRCCDLENLIHVWKSENSLTKKENIENFKKIYQNNFKIMEIYYDCSKTFIYKFKMKAIAIGITYTYNNYIFLLYRDNKKE
jgi:hypothetical protein